MRGSADVAGRELGWLTRDGFPWPSEVPMWHATTALSSILRQGFRVRRQGLTHALGGGTDVAVSLTLDPRVAWSIAVGLRVLRLGARREMSLGELVGAASRQLYHKTVDAALESWSKGQFGGLIADPYEGIRRLDEGWVVESDRGIGRRPPPGSEPLGGCWEGAGGVLYCHQWWRRIEEVEDEDLRRRWRDATAFYNLYNALLTFGAAEREVYNPVFWMTNMPALAAIRSEDEIGVLRVRSTVPRICANAQGAYSLGYLTREEANRDNEALGTFERNCAWDLDRRSGGGRRARGRAWPMPRRLQGRSVGPFAVRDTGTRTGRKAMTFMPAMAEVRVYAPRGIQVERSESWSAWAGRTGNRDWIAAPWFSEADLEEVLRGEGSELPGAIVRRRLIDWRTGKRLKARGYAFADVHPGAWKLYRNPVWNVPEGVGRVPFEVDRGWRGAPRSLRGLAVSLDGKVFGLRTAHDLVQEGFTTRGRISLKGRKVPVFTSSKLFERSDGSLVDVAVLVVPTAALRRLGLPA